MSNAELYYEQLTDLSVRIAVGIKNRTDPLKDLNDKMTQLSQTNAIKGSAANSMKAYIGEVHMTLLQTLQLLLNNYEMALGKYVKGYLGVDSNESFKLIKEDFDDHERKLRSHRLDFTSIGSKLKAISDEAEDILSLAGAGSKCLFNVANEMDAMKKTVIDLKDRWNSYEQTDPGFNEVQELIAQTKALLKSTLSVPRGYSYSPGSFSKLMSKNFVDAFIANANYAQDANNQKAFKDDWDSISKNYTADQKRMAEEARKKAEEEGLIGLIWDGLQICAGTALVVTGVGTGFGVVLIAGGVNSAINDASMATTGKSFNIVGNLTNGALQWYNKNIGSPLVKTGNPIAKFVAGLGNGAIEVAGGMGQFSVYDMGKTAYSLTNPQVRAQFGASLGNWWNQVRSGNAYVIGQTTATVASLFVGGEDIGVAVSKASKAESLLGKVGTFSKSIAVSSVENVKSLLPKVKGALSDVGTASVTFAKTFGKTFAEESGKYANTCFDVLGAAATGVKIGGKAIVAGEKEVKSVFKVVKAEENGLVQVEADSELKLISEYANNDIFGKSVSFKAGEGGTGITYKVFQRNDIDWDMVRSTGAKKGRGLTNAEAAEKYGLAPILDADGNVATLHHSQQRNVGPLFEASTRYHNISNAKRAPLHPYKGQLNPFNPMSEEVRKAFQKVDSIEYWKTRGKDILRGVK